MQFHVHAVDARQQVVSLTLEAVSEAAAVELARLKGLSVFSIKSTKGALAHRLQLRKAAHFPTMLFSAELASLREAGLTLVEALSTLAEKHDASGSGKVLAAILASIQRGEPFSQALGAWPR